MVVDSIFPTNTLFSVASARKTFNRKSLYFETIYRSAIIMS